jgi:dihydrofolate synthase / folylpolyglutamate synthase
MQSYSSVLDYLFNQLPMFQRVGAAALKFDLSNITRLVSLFDNPQSKFRSIHIAGTNGKGSVSHGLASVLQEQGYKVGLYTSPHYRDYRERIKINGQLIPKTTVTRLVNRVLAEPEAAKLQPSFFEFTLALAFLYFEEEKVDYAVLETGLGGRLDSTNIVTPILSVITNIGLDHQDRLGDTLPQIAGEKAGIIKPHVPVVIGEYQAEVHEVFKEVAKQNETTLYLAEDLLQQDGALLSAKEFSGLLEHYEAPYMAKNLTTIIASFQVLRQADPSIISKANLLKGLIDMRQNTTYLGRWQYLGANPTILADAAHNQPGLELLMAKLKQMTYTNLHIVIGMVNDKPLDKVLALFPQEAKYYFVKANIPRGLEAKLLQAQAAALELKGKAYTSVKKGLAAAKQSASESDLILVTGSIFTVAEVV